MKIGTIKRKRCKATKRFIKMYYLGKNSEETGEFNGHKNWLCLHRGK